MGTAKTEPCICESCLKEFQASIYNIRKGWGLFCSRACMYAGRKARPRTGTARVIRQLAPGEPSPQTIPKRYHNSGGYAVLRWRLSKGQYVECLEHRFVSGVATAGTHVHHINGIKDDNDLDNLEPMTASAHMRHHHPTSWSVEDAARLYLEGWSLPRLGRHYGIHSTTVLRAFQARGIQRRPSTFTRS